MFFSTLARLADLLAFKMQDGTHRRALVKGGKMQTSSPSKPVAMLPPEGNH